MQSYSQYPVHSLRLVVNDLINLIEQDEEAIDRHQDSELLRGQYEALRIRHIHELADLLKEHYNLKASPFYELPLF